MEANESLISSSIFDVTQKLIQDFGSGDSEQIKSYLRNLNGDITNAVQENPLRALGIAFSLGFVVTNLLRSPQHREVVQKRLASAAGTALVYVMADRMVKQHELAQNPGTRELH